MKYIINKHTTVPVSICPIDDTVCIASNVPQETLKKYISKFSEAGVNYIFKKILYTELQVVGMLKTHASGSLGEKERKVKAVSYTPAK